MSHSSLSASAFTSRDPRNPAPPVIATFGLRTAGGKAPPSPRARRGRRIGAIAALLRPRPLRAGRLEGRQLRLELRDPGFHLRKVLSRRHVHVLEGGTDLFLDRLSDDHSLLQQLDERGVRANPVGYLRHHLLALRPQRTEQIFNHLDSFRSSPRYPERIICRSREKRERPPTTARRRENEPIGIFRADRQPTRLDSRAEARHRLRQGGN